MKKLHPSLWLAVIGLSVSTFAHADFDRGGVRVFNGQGVNQFVPQPAQADFGRGGRGGFGRGERGGFGRGGDHGRGGRGGDFGRGGGHGDDRRDDRRDEHHSRVNRICFYDQPNYRGNSFCMEQGQQLDSLVPSGWNDRIASAFVEGRVEVVAYNDIHFRSLSLTLTNSEPDLRSKMQYWGISSIIFKAPPSDPLPGGDGRDDPRNERNPRICFFDQPNFRGNSFCMNPGETIENLVPSGWNDRIRSFVVHGFAEAVLWNDAGIHGANKNVSRSDNFSEIWGVTAIQMLRGPTNPFGR